LLDTVLLDDPRLVKAAVQQLKMVTGQTLDLSACTQPSDISNRVEAMRSLLHKRAVPDTKPAR
jgi:hypothetical protein